MRLRWLIKEDGERVLQYENAFGWHGVEEVSEAEEWERSRAAREEQMLREIEEAQRRERAAIRHFERFK